jgi:sugar O-acyltransferase (sialic acid O-acetyltransferase NeuD family)
MTKIHENKNVIVLGDGGHASVIIDLLELLNIKDITICTNNLGNNEQYNSLYNYICEAELLSKQYSCGENYLINGLGSVNSLKKRIEIYTKFKKLKFSFINLIHPFSYVSKSARLGDGVQIFAGSILQPNLSVEDNVIINTKVSVDHDCIIKSHVHLAPGVTISGGVTIGAGTHIGTGATVIQGVNIGENCHIGAGCLITEDVPSNSKVRMEMKVKVAQ